MRTRSLWLIALVVLGACGRNFVPIAPLDPFSVVLALAILATDEEDHRASSDDNTSGEAEYRAAEAECQRTSGRPCESAEATELRREREAAVAARARTEAHIGRVDNSLPDGLDRASILAGIESSTPGVAACRKPSTEPTTVVVSVKVASDGHVAAITIKSSPDAALGDCVASVVQTAMFAPTRRGGSFSYPFAF